MPKKKTKKRLQKLKLAKAEKKNKEGFPSYKGTPEQELLATLMTNQLRDTFYADAKQLTKEAIELHKQLLKKNPLFYAKALIYARKFGYARLQPQIGLVNLSTLGDKRLFYAIFRKVCLIPTDLRDFIDFSKTGMFRQGLGRAPKKAIINWLKEKLTEYYALKYKDELRDAIRLARPSRKELGDKAPIADWIMGG